MLDESTLHSTLITAYLLCALATFFFSLFTTAPYGRYRRPWWSGPNLPSTVGWILMELPQPVVFALCFIAGERKSGAALAFLGMWMFHYAYRTVIYPFIPRASTLSLSVVALGFLLNIGFGYLNGRWLFTLGPERSVSWLLDGRFLVGSLLFFGGFALCSSSDLRLRRLRTPGETAYRIPEGGGFRFVTCPHYLGEITEWIGWTLATWSLAGLVLALISVANLVPRARRNHLWMKQKFPDYPNDRRALVPFIF